MSGNPDTPGTLEQLIRSNARLSKLLEAAHAENSALEAKLRSSKGKIAGLVAGINIATKRQPGSRAYQVVGTMINTMITNHQQGDDHAKHTRTTFTGLARRSQTENSENHSQSEPTNRP